LLLPKICGSIKGIIIFFFFMLRRILSFLIPCFLLGITSAFAGMQSAILTIDDNTPNVFTNYHIIMRADSEGFVYTYGELVMPDVDFTDIGLVSFSINGGEETAMSTALNNLGNILIV
jgi:hypothetical protein